MAKRTGTPLDKVIDYKPLPLLWEHDGLSFVALQTGKTLHAEGAAMHHCVATYWRNVVSSESRIYSIRDNGNRAATLELGNRPINYRWGTGRYQVRQLVGACNSRPAPEVAKAVDTFVEEINNRFGASGASPTPRAHGPISTASAVSARG
jgi:hypothetical protein